MAQTKIPWATHTVNPIRVKGGKVWPHGYHCTKVSPGCTYCYAEAMNGRFGTGLPYDDHKVEFYLDLSVFDTLPKKPCIVFVQSMGDLFHEDVGWNIIYKVFERMLLADWHKFIVLTKRSDRMKKIMPDIWYHLNRNYPDKEFPLKNVIGMVTAENQEQADIRIPDLLQSRFAIRGVSIEPMLGAVDLSEFQPFSSIKYKGTLMGIYGLLNPINWIILGAESGPKARHIDYMEMVSVVQQCNDAGIPAFVKQIHNPFDGSLIKDIGLFPPELRIRQYPTFDATER